MVVCGRKLRPFLEMLIDLGPDIRRCQHLFLSDVDEEIAERIRIFNAKRKALAQAGDPKQYDKDLELEALAFTSYSDNDDERSMYGCLRRIVELNASTLETLAISVMHIQTTILFPISFPLLVDLSLISLNLFGHPHLELSDAPFPSLPALRRLHVVCLWEASFMHSISQIAPHLTHFRVTGKGCIAFLPLEFLPESIKKVLVQPSYLWNSTPGLNQLRYQTMTLRTIAQAREQEICPHIIMLSPRDKPSWLAGGIEFWDYGFHDALRDWRDMVEGEEIFWDIVEEDPEVTKAAYRMLQSY